MRQNARPGSNRQPFSVGKPNFWHRTLRLIQRQPFPMATNEGANNFIAIQLTELTKKSKKKVEKHRTTGAMLNKHLTAPRRTGISRQPAVAALLVPFAPKTIFICIDIIIVTISTIIDVMTVIVNFRRHFSFSKPRRRPLVLIYRCRTCLQTCHTQSDWG